ncbi:hypothetical protein BDW42DRAFT_164583, partial [Aspergillus taichungensis]
MMYIVFCSGFFSIPFFFFLFHVLSTCVSIPPARFACSEKTKKVCVSLSLYFVFLILYKKADIHSFLTFRFYQEGEEN